jgi:regulatory protein YycH of two-component signal transduction system YycFG
MDRNAEKGKNRWVQKREKKHSISRSKKRRSEKLVPVEMFVRAGDISFKIAQDGRDSRKHKQKRTEQTQTNII